MNNLKIKILEILEQAVPTYYEKASKNAIYPYCVFELEKVQRNYKLEINLYDIAQSSYEIDEKMEQICSLFELNYYVTDNFVIETDLNSTNSFVEENTKRRRILVDINYKK